jgi:Carbohydrate-selective porin, OprB family
VRLDRDILTLPKSEPPRGLGDRWTLGFRRLPRTVVVGAPPATAGWPTAKEKIFEAYYSYKLNGWSALTFDYQFIADPAYNADRGPVLIFSARAHAEF